MTRSPSTDRRYELTLELRAPRRAVWKALTDADELKRWFAPEAEVDARVGGKVVWRWREDIAWPQVVEAVEEERLLRTRYDSGVGDGGGGRVPLFVEFHLQGREGGTTLRVVHSGFGPEAEFDAEYDGISRGWPVELRSLRHYLEIHPGRRREVVAVLADIGELQPEEAWSRLCGPDGLGCAEALRDKLEGEAYRFETPGGESFEGTVLTQHPREFSAVVDSHGKAWLRCCVENCGGRWLAWVWLATYDLEAARLDATRRGFEAIAERLFGARP